MHNKAEEPIGKETDHLPYISSGVVCSSFVNIHLKRNKCVIVAFSDTFKIFWSSERLLIFVILLQVYIEFSCKVGNRFKYPGTGNTQVNLYTNNTLN